MFASLLRKVLPGVVAMTALLFAQSTTLVINEIDYDQPGTDTAEFLEIKNVSSSAIDLSLYEVVLVNGTGGGATIYNTIALPNVMLAAGDYFVICGNGANVPNCDLDVTPDQNLIQNGAPDAVAIQLAGGGAVVDAVSYEGDSGAPYTEGSGVGLEDSSTVDAGGISRVPDGVDTDQNNIDLRFTAITPGSANAPLGVADPLPGVVPSQSLLLPNFPNPFNPSTTVAFDLPHASLITLRVFDATGREVRTLASGQMPAGRHQVVWDGTDDEGHPVAGGVYFYRLIVLPPLSHRMQGDERGVSQTRKMLLVR